MKSFILVLLAAFLVAGCATVPRTDWDARIGTYTYDEAIRELGAPESTESQPDNSRVAVWLTQRGQRGSIGYGMGSAFVSPGYGQALPHHTPATPNRYLRLRFAADGRLTSWERFDSFR